MTRFKRACAGLFAACFLAIGVASVIAIVAPRSAQAIPSGERQLFRSQVDFALDPNSSGLPRARGFRDRSLQSDDKRDLVLNIAKTAEHPSTRTIVLTQEEGGDDEYYIDVCQLGRNAAAADSGFIYDGQSGQINIRKLEKFINQEDTRFINALGKVSASELSSRKEIYKYVADNYRDTSALSRSHCENATTNMLPSKFRKLQMQIGLDIDQEDYNNLSQDEKVSSFMMVIRRADGQKNVVATTQVQVPTDTDQDMSFSIDGSAAINAFRTYEIGYLGANNEFKADLSGRFFGLCQTSGSQTDDTFYYTKDSASDFDCGDPKILVPFRVKFALNLADLRKIKAGEDARVASGASAPVNDAGVNVSDSTIEGEAEEVLECDASWNPLTWIICPLIAAANETVQLLDNAIVSQLNVNEDDYFSQSKTGESFYGVWSNFRYIGLVLLVITALVMVISQAFSVGPFDAYTVKKVLPRMLMAVIFMTLSWEICKFLIAVTNDVGLAVRTIIQAPFAGVDAAVINQGASSVGALALTGLGLSLGLWGMLTFVGTAALAVVVAFVVLAVRKIAIVFLVLVAPFAIACSILPNTQKAYKLWWDTFSKALLMFPIIMGFIAVGRVFAKVAATNDSLISQLIVLVAYFGPYFALPYAFRLAGGAIATISGMVNDRSRGAFDRMRKFRQAQPGRRLERAQRGNLWRGNNAVAIKASALALGATQLNKAGLRPSRWRANMASATGLQNFDSSTEFMEKNQTFRALQGDDDKLWAIQRARNANEAREILKKRAPERFSDPRTLDQAVAEVMRVKREGGDKVARIAATRAQAGSGTGYNYRQDGIDDDFLTAIIEASDGDRTLSGRLLAEGRGKLRESGRMEFAGGFAKTAQIMDKRRAALAGEIEYSAEDAMRDIMRDSIDSNGGAVIAGKVRAVENMAPVMLENVQGALFNTDVRMSSAERQAAAARELASLASKYDVAAQVAPQNAEALQDGVLMKDVDVRSLPIDMQNMLMPAIQSKDKNGNTILRDKVKILDLINGMRDNQNFQSMRRELGTSAMTELERRRLIEQGLEGNIGQLPTQQT